MPSYMHSQERDITLTDTDGQIMPAETFLAAIHPSSPPSTSAAPAAEPTVYGASLRWAVAADQDKSFQVEVQSLPKAA